MTANRWEVPTTSNPAYNLATPKYKGAYQLGGKQGLQIALSVRPMCLHRQMMKWAFGWVWVDFK